MAAHVLELRQEAPPGGVGFGVILVNLDGSTTQAIDPRWRSIACVAAREKDPATHIGSVDLQQFHFKHEH